MGNRIGKPFDNNQKNNKDIILLIIGFATLFLGYLFFLVIGEDLYVIVHDQLDMEITTYMLKTESWISLFKSEFSQFMKGNARVSVASFGSLFFYVVLPPLYAFITNMFFVRTIAFIGLFLLLRKFQVENVISFYIAMVFSILPIYSVYGLSIMGISMVWLGVKEIQENNNFGYILIAIYGLFSSFVLVGFSIIGCMIFYAIHVFYNKKHVYKILLAILLLLFVYVLTNFDLLLSFFNTNNDYVPHRYYWKLSSTPFLISFKSLLIDGKYHCASLHKYFIPVIAFALFLFAKKIAVRRKGDSFDVIDIENLKS